MQSLAKPTKMIAKESVGSLEKRIRLSQVHAIVHTDLLVSSNMR